MGCSPHRRKKHLRLDLELEINKLFFRLVPVFLINRMIDNE